MLFVNGNKYVINFLFLIQESSKTGVGYSNMPLVSPWYFSRPTPTAHTPSPEDPWGRWTLQRVYYIHGTRLPQQEIDVTVHTRLSLKLLRVNPPPRLGSHEAPLQVRPDTLFSTLSPFFAFFSYWYIHKRYRNCGNLILSLLSEHTVCYLEIKTGLFCLFQSAGPVSTFSFGREMVLP